MTTRNPEAEKIANQLKEWNSNVGKVKVSLMNDYQVVIKK